MMRRFFSRLFTRWFRRADELPETASTPGSAHGHTQGAMAPMLDCESVMRQLWDYLDNELRPERMAALRAHLEMCKRCYPQYEFERAFLDAVAASAREHSNPDRLRTKLIDALRVEGLSEA